MSVQDSYLNDNEHMITEQRKYEFNGEIRVVYGRRLRRIRAISGIPAFDIKSGQLGGWISCEANLSQDGDAWVDGDAQVFDNARVFGNAKISGNAQVFGNARISGNVRVYSSAQIEGNAQLFENTQAYGNAWIYGDALIYGNACVYGDTEIFGFLQIYGDARIKTTPIFAMRSDGYAFLVVPTPDGARIIAGCRYFSFPEARQHWRETRGGTRLGEETFDILDLLEKQAVRHGFMGPIIA